MRKLVICLLVCLFIVPSAWGFGGKFWGHGDKIRVLDWNVYIGTDLLALLNGFISVDEAVEQVIDSNPAARMKTIAKHIKFLRPRVVFLQEVWQVAVINEKGELEFFVDFLAELLAELHNYKVAGLHVLTDFVLPTSSGWASAIDRDVVLVCKNMDVEPEVNVRYNVLAPLPFPPSEVGRGYTKIQATIHGKPYLLVNTHLEVGPPVRELQAQQLAMEIGALPDTVILGGDFNDEPPSDTYSAMINAGFIDSWEEKKIGRWDKYGDTCCQDVDLRNKVSQLDQRIDYLFTRNGKFLVFSGRVIGDRRFNKTRTFPRLWPSDHGGLIFTLINCD